MNAKHHQPYNEVKITEKLNSSGSKYMEYFEESIERLASQKLTNYPNKYNKSPDLNAYLHSNFKRETKFSQISQTPSPITGELEEIEIPQLLPHGGETNFEGSPHSNLYLGQSVFSPQTKFQCTLNSKLGEYFTATIADKVKQLMTFN
jgi:hypothetical protein